MRDGQHCTPPHHAGSLTLQGTSVVILNFCHVFKFDFSFLTSTLFLRDVKITSKLKLKKGELLKHKNLT